MEKFDGRIHRLRDTNCQLKYLQGEEEKKIKRRERLGRRSKAEVEARWWKVPRDLWCPENRAELSNFYEPPSLSFFILLFALFECFHPIAWRLRHLEPPGTSFCLPSFSKALTHFHTYTALSTIFLTSINFFFLFLFSWHFR